MKYDAHFYQAPVEDVAGQTRPPATDSASAMTEAFATWRAQLAAIPGAIETKSAQKALVAGARKMRDGIKMQAQIAFDTNRVRKPLGPVALAKGRTPPAWINPLIKSIVARQGKTEWFPSAIVALSYRGQYVKAPRHARLVDQGHAGPKPSSRPTPPHPFVEPGILASESVRDQAILATFQKLHPQVLEEVRNAG